VIGAAEYCGGFWDRYEFAAVTDRGAKAVKAGLTVLFDLKAGAGLTDEGGGRAGSEAGGCVVEDLRPGGAGYDMMNVYSGLIDCIISSHVPNSLFKARETV